jgi:hypothetical protein
LKIFPIYYFPPVSWFAAAIQQDSIALEAHIHYRKQQYYNRARIKGANKIQNLSIPIVRTSENTPFHLREISYAEDWQKLHWKSLEAAYRSSAYFEYYESDLEEIFAQQFSRLQDLNLAILEMLFRRLQIEVPFSLTESYALPSADGDDFRHAFDGRGNQIPSWFEPVPYRQVFEGFDPDLSILDLMCNMGPESVMILRQCWKPEQ